MKIKIIEQYRGKFFECHSINEIQFDEALTYIKIHCENKQDYKFFEERLLQYVRIADQDVIDPRRFTIDFNDEEQAIVCKGDLAQALDFFIAYKIINKQLKTKFINDHSLTESSTYPLKRNDDAIEDLQSLSIRQNKKPKKNLCQKVLAWFHFSKSSHFSSPVKKTRSSSSVGENTPLLERR